MHYFSDKERYCLVPFFLRLCVQKCSIVQVPAFYLSSFYSHEFFFPPSKTFKKNMLKVDAASPQLFCGCGHEQKAVKWHRRGKTREPLASGPGRALQLINCLSKEMIIVLGKAVQCVIIDTQSKELNCTVLILQIITS